MSERQSKNPIGLALLVLASVGGGWFALNRYEISGLDGLRMAPRGGSGRTFDDPQLPPSIFGSDLPNPSRQANQVDAQWAVLGGNERMPSTFASTRSPAETAATEPQVRDDLLPSEDPRLRPVRIGSWALAGLDRNKLAKPRVMDKICRIIRQFELIALQQITSPERDLLPRLINQINATGRSYDYILGPTVGPHGADIGRLGEQYAFVFDTERIETDRAQTYTVADPGKQISYDPLVGWFRIRGVPADRAWTFTLVNFRVDSTRPVREITLVAKLMDSVAKDGRLEDDLLLAGMLHADDRQLMTYLGESTTHAAVQSTPTDIFGRYQLSNIIAPKTSSTEYLGRGGVVDFPRAFDLNEAAAEEVSPHLPVFAEFTATEGN
jgi:hypothetical protein